MRSAQFAGTFYEKGENTLKNQITACFEGPKGPGATPVTGSGQQPLAVLAPHAGYQYSGECSAWSFKALGDATLADLYIILAPSHRAGNSALTMETFETPFGMVRVDQDFARRLLEKETIGISDQLHQVEHSIEVQLPFLQFAFWDKREQIKILPLLISHDVDLQQLAVDIKEVMVETGKNPVFIVSSDFTHYGSNYHFAPYSSDVQENIAKLDKGAIERIKKGNSEEFLAYVDDTMATICGALPIALLLRLIRPNKVQLEQYYTSASITNTPKSSVSYASLVFY